MATSRSNRWFVGLVASTVFGWQLAPGSDFGAAVYPGRSKAFIGGFGGSLSARESPGQLERGRSEFTWGLSFGYRPNRFLVLGGDIVSLERTYDAPLLDAPLFGAYSSEMTLDSAAVTFTAKGVLPLRRVEPFVGGGMGIYYSEAVVDGVFLILPIQEKEEELNLGLHLVAGVDIVISPQWNVGVEFRRHWLDSNFGHLSNGKVDIGGESAAVVARFFL